MNKCKNNDINEGRHNKVLLLVEFYLLYDREPKAREEYKGVLIGNLLQKIRSEDFKLTEEEYILLSKVGFRVNHLTNEEKNNDKAALLIDFIKEYKRFPYSKEEYKKVKIGRFYDRVRQGKTKISEKDLKNIKELGFELKFANADEDIKHQVHNKVRLLIEFYKLYKREPKQREEYKGKNIGIFLMNIRQNRIKLLKKDIVSLQKAGIRI